MKSYRIPQTQAGRMMAIATPLGQDALLLSRMKMSKSDGSSQGSYERLRAIIAAFPGQGFAVVDGGHFEDLPARLKHDRLFARQLFLDQADAEVQKAGPWLIGLAQEPDATEKVFAIAADKPAAVFWCCDAGEAILYRHLRTIAMARIPDWAADGKAAPEHSDDPFKTVFFRHYDPRVLSTLLPCLDALQFSRFLGPAEEIAFQAPPHGARRVVADPGWPKAAPGLLVVRGDQCVNLVQRRVTASNVRSAAYLRRYAPGNVADLDDAGLGSAVRTYEGQARAFGVRHESAIALWSYLQTTSRDDLSQHPKVRRFLTSPSNGSTPESRVEALFDLRTAALKRKFE